MIDKVQAQLISLKVSGPTVVVSWISILAPIASDLSDIVQLFSAIAALIASSLVIAAHLRKNKKNDQN